MPRCDACHTTAVGKYGTLIWKSRSGYKLYTPVRGGAEWIGPFGWSSFCNAAWARDFRMEALLAAFKGLQHACWNDAVFSFATFGVLHMLTYMFFVLDIPFTVPFLGGFPIRGSKLNLVGEFIRGRNAQLTKLHLTRDLHCTPGVRRCACLLCCSPLSWEDLQRRPVSPEKIQLSFAAWSRSVPERTLSCRSGLGESQRGLTNTR